MLTITEVEKRIIEINEKKTKNTEEYRKFIESCNKELSALEIQKDILIKDLNLERIQRAKNIIDLQMSKVAYSDLVELAIKDLASGCEHMKRRYFGAKNYDRYTDQRCDCRYGYGPTHGRIIFSIGLNNPKKELEPDEIEDCLYYLNNFFKIYDDAKMSITN